MKIEQLPIALHLLALEDALKLAGISPTDTPSERLKKDGVRHFDEIISEQLKPWLALSNGPKRAIRRFRPFSGI